MRKTIQEIAIVKAKGKSGSSSKTAVIKATRSDDTPPKKKHVDFLVASTKGNKPNLHAILAALRSRGQQKDWKVALKVLCVAHRLIRDADPSFAQACSRTSITVATDFADVKSEAAVGQSQFIRIYSRYLEHKLKIVRKFGVQFEEMPEKLYEYEYPELFAALKFMLVQLAYILELEGRIELLDNQIALSAFAMILRDSVNLYGALLKGFLRVTDEYQEMCRTEVEDAADLYEKFLDYSERLIDSFYPKCKRFTNQLPQFDPAPESMLKELDRFAKTAPENPPEGRKRRIMDKRDAERDTGSKRVVDKRVKEVDARRTSIGGGGSGSGSSSSKRASGGQRKSTGGSARKEEPERRRGDRERDRPRDRGDRPKRDKYGRRESDVSFEDIPRDWDRAESRVSSGSRRKDKEEVQYSDDARSDEVSRSEEEAAPDNQFALIDLAPPQSNRPPQSFAVPTPQPLPAQFFAPAPQQQPAAPFSSPLPAPMAPLSGPSAAAYNPPLSGGYGAPAPFVNTDPSFSSPPPQQQYNRASVADPFASASAASTFDPFAPSSQPAVVSSPFSPAVQPVNPFYAASPAPAVSPSVSSPFGQVPVQQQQQQPMSPFSPATASYGGNSSLSYDPFSTSNVPLVSGYPVATNANSSFSANQPFFSSPSASTSSSARLFPASSQFAPSLPAIAKAPSQGPNLLDANQFDPFAVVNL